MPLYGTRLRSSASRKIRSGGAPFSAAVVLVFIELPPRCFM
jgi:hypothetical protein